MINNNYRIIKLVKFFDDGTSYSHKVSISKMNDWFKKVEPTISFYRNKNKSVRRKFVDWYIHEDGFPRVIIVESDIGTILTSNLINGFITIQIKENNRPSIASIDDAFDMIGTRPRLDEYKVVDFFVNDNNEVLFILHREA